MTDQQFSVLLNLLRLVMAAVAAVCAFLLSQPDVELEPVMRVILGAIIVALAVINPSGLATRVQAARSG